jgi:hypothetical protein
MNALTGNKNGPVDLSIDMNALRAMHEIMPCEVYIGLCDF